LIDFVAYPNTMADEFKVEADLTGENEEDVQVDFMKTKKKKKKTKKAKTETSAADQAEESSKWDIECLARTGK